MYKDGEGSEGGAGALSDAGRHADEGNLRMGNLLKGGSVRREAP